MLYGSETWCLKKNEMAVLRRTERAMVRAMCGAKLLEKRRTEDLMEMSGLKEKMVQMAKANRVRWYGHVLRRDDGHVLRKALEFEVKGKRKRGQPRRTCKMQVEKESRIVGLKKEDALNRATWRVGVGEIAARVGYIWPTPFTGRINPDQNWNWNWNYTSLSLLLALDININQKTNKYYDSGYLSIQVRIQIL